MKNPHYKRVLMVTGTKKAHTQAGMSFFVL